MAIKKSTFTGGNGRPMLHSPYQANVPAQVIIEHTFKEALATTDILELAYLPAHCKIISAELLSQGTSTTTLTVGFMSGRVGDTDPARTSGAELFSAATPTTLAEMTLAALAALPTSDADRSIGVKASAAIAASGSTKLQLRLTYVKAPQYA